MSKGWEVAKLGIRLSIPLAGPIIDGVERAAKAINSASDEGFDALKKEVAKQEVRLRFELQQAKIAQELAIAQRISSAEIVEIEEFYDVSAGGQAGAQMNEGSIVLGFGAEKKGVTKRIYQFKGFRELGVVSDGRDIG